MTHFLKTAALALLVFSLAACVAAPNSSSSSHYSASSTPAALSSQSNDSSANTSSRFSSVPTSSSSAVITSSASSQPANQPPTVAFASPVDGYRFLQGQSVIAVTADAADSDSNLASVSLYVDDALVSTLTASPYRWAPSTLNHLLAGTHTLKLVATDTHNAQASAQISVLVEQAPNVLPLVAISYPADGAVLPNLSSVDVVVNATDSDGNIASVSLSLDGQVLAVVDQPPFTWPARFLPRLANLAEGRYSLQAIAKDNRGGTAMAQSDFEILEPNDFPTLSFAAPAKDLILPVNSTLTVLANATDSDGTITEVDLYINETLVGTDKNYPYEFTPGAITKLNKMAVGNYILKLTATDNKGGISAIEQAVIVSASAQINAGDPALGATQYLTTCITCHAQFGQGNERGPAIIPVKQTYSVNNQSYSLTAFINDFMPKNYSAACTDQCARNVSAYIKNILVGLNAESKTWVGDATTGEVEYQLQCQGCHGAKGLGGTKDVVLFPLRDTHDYSMQTFSAFISNTSLFTLIDIGMPVGANGYPEGYADSCTGQCTANVIAYLKKLESQLTPAEQKTIQIAAGKKQYSNYCSGCHGADGRKRGIIPLTSAERTNNTLDNNDALFKRNRDTMPPSDPKSCEGQCAKDVTVYIREVLDK